MGTFRIMLFAGLRDEVGADYLSLTATNIVTTEDLLALLKRQHPELMPWLKFSRLAVNRRFALANMPIDPTSEIALIPPVSGG